MNILESLNKGFESKYSMSSSRRPVARKPLHEAKSTRGKGVELSNVKGTVGKIIKDNIEKINKSTSKESLIKIMSGLLKNTNGKGKEDFLAELSKTSNYGAAMKYVYDYMLKGDNLGVNEGKKLNERKNKRCRMGESFDRDCDCEEESDESLDEDKHRSGSNALTKVKKYLKSQGVEMEESIGTDIARYQKWVDYDMKRYGDISDTTMSKIKKAGLSVTKDQYGDYEVIAKEPVRECKKLREYKNVGQDMAEYQKWVDYDMERYGRVSRKTMREIEEAGLSLVKDQYGDYEVIAKEPVRESKRPMRRK